MPSTNSNSERKRCQVCDLATNRKRTGRGVRNRSSVVSSVDGLGSGRGIPNRTASSCGRPTCRSRRAGRDSHSDARPPTRVGSGPGSIAGPAFDIDLRFGTRRATKPAIARFRSRMFVGCRSILTPTLHTMRWWGTSASSGRPTWPAGPL